MSCLRGDGTPVCVDLDKRTYWATIYVFILQVNYLIITAYANKSICLDYSLTCILGALSFQTKMLHVANAFLGSPNSDQVSIIPAPSWRIEVQRGAGRVGLLLLLAALGICQWFVFSSLSAYLSMHVIVCVCVCVGLFVPISLHTLSMCEV